MVYNLSAVGKTAIIFLCLLDFHIPCVMIRPDDPWNYLNSSVFKVSCNSKSLRFKYSLH
jgi:hypothetical protein